MIRSHEAFNFYSHLLGMFAATVGTFFLLMHADSPSLVVMAIVVLAAHGPLCHFYYDCRLVYAGVLFFHGGCMESAHDRGAMELSGFWDFFANFFSTSATLFICRNLFVNGLAVTDSYPASIKRHE